MERPERAEADADAEEKADAEESQAPTETELLIAGRYQMLSLLGSGGMGSVYRVRDRELDEEVALKLFRHDLATTPGMLASFRQEVKLARRVTHANVARTFDIGRHGNDWFLTMEYVRGRSLGATLANDGPPPIARVIEILSQICGGVAAAHEVGVVHRDLKPENVMIAANEGRQLSVNNVNTVHNVNNVNVRAVVTDFGIARVREEGREASMNLVGTPAYMAPEQVNDPGGVGPRADIYALGAILFEMLTGRRAWPGAFLASIVKRLDSPPPDPRTVRPDLPSPLAEAVMCAMARDPSERFSSATLFAEHVAELSLPRIAAIATPPRTIRSPEPAGVRTIAVQPFENAGPPEDDYLASGLTHDLAESLGTAPNLRVALLSSTQKNPHVTENTLGVLAVVRARIFRVADSVRITASLVGVDNNFTLWSTRTTTPFADLLKATDTMAAQIADALTLDHGLLGEVDRDRLSSLDAVAIDLYLRARAKYHTDFATSKEAPALFEKALEHAPDNPSILAGYALSLTRGGGPFSTADAGLALIKAREAAERAVSLAPHSTDARVALARVRLDEGRPVAAADELRIALSTGQTNADVLMTWGWILSEAGDLDGALVRLRVAKKLDPHFYVADIEMARAYAFLGDWDTTEELLHRAEGSDPGLAYACMMQRVRFFAGWRRNPDRARALLRDVEARPDLIDRPGMRAQLETLASSVMTPAVRVALEGAAQAASGVPRRRAFAYQTLAELCSATGDDEGTLAALAQADEASLFDLAWVDRCPLFDELREGHDPRFEAIRASVAARVLGVASRLGG